MAGSTKQPSYEEKLDSISTSVDLLLSVEPTFMCALEAIYGNNGLTSVLTNAEKRQFSHTQVNSLIMSRLRELQIGRDRPKATRKILVRLPQSVYEQVRSAASGQEMSMNAWCVETLLRGAADTLSQVAGVES